MFYFIKKTFGLLSLQFSLHQKSLFFSARWGRGIITVLLIALLFLSGCKDWSKVAPGSTVINATITDRGFYPKTWRVPAGTQITMHIKNEGQATHNWTLMARPIETPFTQQDEANILFQVTVESGKTKIVHFTTPKAPMAYQVLSTLPGDMENGLTATLVVVIADPRNEIQ